VNPYLTKLQRGPSRQRIFKRARVEIVPLIDVMFLLVAFFMVVSISMVTQKGIFVDLAPAETSDSSMDDKDALVVSVDAKGDLFLDKAAVTALELEEILRRKALDNLDVSVTINADKDARHSDVIGALDLVRRSKLHNVIFSVEPKE
jgi:biopolymer transport protein ExbD